MKARLPKIFNGVAVKLFKYCHLHIGRATVEQLVAVLLMCTCNMASADWTVVDGNSVDGSTFYVDIETIHKLKSKVLMWDLQDFEDDQTRGNTQFRSVKSQQEYDCTNSEFRKLIFELYSGNMESSNVVYLGADNASWEPIEPNAMSESLWKIACNEK